MMRRRLGALFVAAIIGAAARASAQATTPPEPPPQPLTLDAAITYAAAHYPSLRASAEQVRGAGAIVDVAHASYLPRLDALWQSNRGTANNVFGQVLPQSVIPALSGPVLSSASGDAVWGSAAGALLSWEAIDFGLRDAGVKAAESGLGRAQADEQLARLEVTATVANAFLAVASADSAVDVAQADAERRGVLARAVHALADNELRPGAEATRSDAERAAAETRLIQAREAAAIARVTLGRSLGMTGPPIALDAAALWAHPPSDDLPAPAAAAHPLGVAHAAAVEQARAQEGILLRTDRPRLFLQGSVSARGSGATTSGPFDGGIGGLGLDRVNWAAGVQLQFPNVFDFGSLRARRAAAAAAVNAERAQYDEAILAVEAQRGIAAAMASASRAVLANVPVQLAAARQSEAQARARYDAGLGDLVAVAEAQNLLALAEAQDRLARIDAWRALLAEAVAGGDLAPFLDRVRRAGSR
jgi:outer membrane protein TolC